MKRMAPIAHIRGAMTKPTILMIFEFGVEA